MYMTRLELRPGSRTTAALMGNAQRLHGELCRLVDSDRATNNILYRTARNAIYMTSDKPVNMAHASDGVTLGASRDLTDWVNAFHEGQIAAFDLLAMPSYKQSRQGQKNSARVTLSNPEERMAWLRKQAEKHGFTLLGVEEKSEQITTGYHRGEDGQFVLRGYQYTGVLQITDEIRFRAALVNGIGPGKAYGFGMLMVKPR